MEQQFQLKPPCTGHQMEQRDKKLMLRFVPQQINTATRPSPGGISQAAAPRSGADPALIRCQTPAAETPAAALGGNVERRRAAVVVREFLR